jgi:hypothetical protein
VSDNISFDMLAVARGVPDDISFDMLAVARGVPDDILCHLLAVARGVPDDILCYLLAVARGVPDDILCHLLAVAPGVSDDILFDVAYHSIYTKLLFPTSYLCVYKTLPVPYTSCTSGTKTNSGLLDVVASCYHWLPFFSSLPPYSDCATLLFSGDNSKINPPVNGFNINTPKSSNFVRP